LGIHTSFGSSGTAFLALICALVFSFAPERQGAARQTQSSPRPLSQEENPDGMEQKRLWFANRHQDCTLKAEKPFCGSLPLHG